MTRFYLLDSGLGLGLVNYFSKTFEALFFRRHLLVVDVNTILETDF